MKADPYAATRVNNRSCYGCVMKQKGAGEGGREDVCACVSVVTDRMVASRSAWDTAEAATAECPQTALSDGYWIHYTQTVLCIHTHTHIYIKLICGYYCRFWYGGEPNNDADEDCAHMLLGGWNDLHCLKQVRWTCEIRV